jgi:hypothetical protein
LSVSLSFNPFPLLLPQAESVEFAQIDKQVLDGIEAGNDALKALSDELNIERVERVMEEAAEMHAWQQEVAELTGNSISDQEIDEDDLWREFNLVRGWAYWKARVSGVCKLFTADLASHGPALEASGRA